MIRQSYIFGPFLFPALGDCHKHPQRAKCFSPTWLNAPQNVGFVDCEILWHFDQNHHFKISLSYEKRKTIFQCFYFSVHHKKMPAEI
jgi:hypothetical protein